MLTRNRTTINVEAGRQDLFITREFDAPRDLVFRAHTDPNLLPQWMGPRRLAMRLETFDPRGGGRWRFISKDTDGSEYGFHGVFHEVTAPERIIQTFEFEGLPETGHVMLETLRLEALPGNRTRLVAQSVFQSSADRDGMVQSGMETGVNEGYERLDELLAELRLSTVKTERELEITRVLEAPRELVWRAWTEAELFRRWFGPKGFTIPHCTIDLRVGGKYLFCMRSPEWQDFWGTGTYREIRPLERLVNTDSFADAQGKVVPATDYGMEGLPLEMLVTVTLEGQGNKTKMTVRHDGLPAGAHREGAGEGWRQSFEKLAALLEEQSRARA